MLDVDRLMALSYDELRELYKKFLQRQNISQSTIKTAYSSAFYLWKIMGKDLFWEIVTAPNFDEVGKEALLSALSEHSSGDAKSLVNGYLSHLRRFRQFVNSNGINKPAGQKKEKTVSRVKNKNSGEKMNVPLPSIDQVEYYLEKWDGLENYHLQEDALNKLFFELCPNNKDIVDILLKASTLNDFYSTNIFSIYPVAKHIYSLDIDERIKSGDVNLVRDIQYITIGDNIKNFYSFASKYCSHHNPIDFPIYDSYVDKMLRFFRERDKFCEFHDSDLKNYVEFKNILTDFRDFYGLGEYSLKQIDQYVWQLGKEYFPKKYKKD